MFDSLRRSMIVAAATGVSVASAACAQDAMTLKVAHGFPAAHYFVEQGGKVLTDAVAAKLKQKVKFDYYPAGQLGKDYVGLLNSGITDIVLLTPSYAPEKFPLTAVAELPELYSSSCEGTGKLWQLAKDGGLLNEREYKSLGMHILFIATPPPYLVMTTSKKISSADDMKGLKIRANGAAMNKAVTALGAVPIPIQTSELYDSHSRGTVDGGLLIYTALPQYHLEKLIHFSAEGVSMGSAVLIFAMSERKWKALPEDVKAAFNEAALPAQQHLCSYMDTENTKVRDKLAAENGLKVVEIAPAQSAVWKEKLQMVASDWAKEGDAKGLKGTEVLDTFKKASAPN